MSIKVFVFGALLFLPLASSSSSINSPSSSFSLIILDCPIVFFIISLAFFVLISFVTTIFSSFGFSLNCNKLNDFFFSFLTFIISFLLSFISFLLLFSISINVGEISCFSFLLLGESSINCCFM